jgi:hypothetical protein
VLTLSKCIDLISLCRPSHKLSCPRGAKYLERAFGHPVEDRFEDS